ncbi:hypothetical protein Csa_006353 [Cucumis sativus]|uniref:Dynein heavy chain n=1 Tax=Cucumis sativus TaxID=3659 RepID=A0A0A0LM42_CUCSA|nr:hypothetical protein Csa_006353 [Cucumis sativus]
MEVSEFCASGGFKTRRGRGPGYPPKRSRKSSYFHRQIYHDHLYTCNIPPRSDLETNSKNGIKNFGPKTKKKKKRKQRGIGNEWKGELSGQKRRRKRRRKKRKPNGENAERNVEPSETTECV